MLNLSSNLRRRLLPMLLRPPPPAAAAAASMIGAVGSAPAGRLRCFGSLVKAGDDVAGKGRKGVELLAIPGVGPRNLRKLVEKGFQGVAELKQLYRDKQQSENMVQYLRESVGIVHKNHAESIACYIKGTMDEETLKENYEKRPQKKRLTFCVEGNISVGKSSFLDKIANESIELRDLIEIVPEPVGKWQDLGPEHFNILDAFYAEPERYAYTFQNYVFVTRVMQEKESAGGIKPLRLMERSVFTDRMVFVRAVHEARWMNEMEISIYDSWFDPVVECMPALVPDGFIYLRASPDTCLKRLMMRKRSEEGGITLDYLQGLHEKHEDWLSPVQPVKPENHGLLSVNQLPIHTDNSLPPNIRGHVFHLNAAHVHSSIKNVPALVLDYETNIDFSRDVEAKAQYASQISEFFKFVKRENDASSTKANADPWRINQQIVLPHTGTSVPGGNPFQGPTFKSLNFERRTAVAC